MDGKERKRGREREREVCFTIAFLTWVNTEEKQTLTRARTMAPKRAHFSQCLYQGSTESSVLSSVLLNYHILVSWF